MPAMIKCDGSLSYAPDSAPLCLDGWVEIDSSQMDLLLMGGFDQDAFELAFEGVFLLWVAGLGVGMVISILRKLKR